MRHNKRKLLVAAAVLALGSTVASADVSINPATVTAPAAGGNVSFAVAYDADPDTWAMQIDIVLDIAKATFVSGTPAADCFFVPPATLRAQASPDIPGTVPSGNICTFVLAAAPGPDGDTMPLAFSNGLFFDSSFGDTGANHTNTDGVLTWVAAGPPTITFDETPLVLPNAAIGDVTSDTVAVTVTDGGGAAPADTASYTCTAPTGFTVSPLAGGPIANGGTLPDLDVSCTAAAAAVNGNILCTATNTAPSSADFTIPVTCPAGVPTAPTLTSTPASGSTITLPAGAPGAVSCATISIAATGGAGMDASMGCTSSDPAITVTPAGPLTFAPGSSPQTVQVCATLTDTPLDIAAAVSCTGTHGPGGIDWGFAAAAPAGSVAPTFVPASSLWSKLALFGIFGVLGMLIIGLRRSH